MSEEVAEPPLPALASLKREPKTEPGEARDSRSPEPNCAICLEGFNNKSFTNSCLHEFCYPCLKEWSKIKPECPLCKQRFQTIIHNIRSPQDYDEYQVEENNPFNVFFNLTAASRFPYSNTLDWRARMQEHRERLQEQRERLQEPREFFPEMHVRPTRDSSYLTVRYLNEYSANVTHRRDVYRHQLWRKPIHSSRVRDSSPDFYRLNPAQTHRLVPWLFRELHVLLDVSLDPNELMNIILQLIRLYPIWSRRFREVLLPAMGGHTDHFLHEFYHFAISPHDIIAYDNVTEYDRPGLIPPPLHRIPLRSYRIDSETDDSDVEVGAERSPERSTDRNRTVMLNDVPVQLTEDGRLPPSITMNLYKRMDTSHNNHFNKSSIDLQVVHPLRGQKLTMNNNLNCGLDLTNRAGPSSGSAYIDDSKNNVVIEISDTSSSDSEVEIIHVRPPTPVVITIDSTESEEEVEVTNIDLSEVEEVERSSWTPMPMTSRESTPPMPCLRPVKSIRAKSARKRSYRSPSTSSTSSSTSSLSSSSSSSSSTTSDSDYRHNRSSRRTKKRKRPVRQRKIKVKPKKRAKKTHTKIYSSSDEGYAR